MTSSFSGYSGMTSSFTQPSPYDAALKQISTLNAHLQPLLAIIQSTQNATELQKLIKQLTLSISLYPSKLVQQTLVNIVSVLNVLNQYWTAINIIPPVTMYSSIKAVLKIKK